MKRTKSKLNLNELQAQFDDLLESFTAEDVTFWKQEDLKLQEEKLFSGKTIEVDSNPVSYVPISCGIRDILYRTTNEPTQYDLAA